VGIVIDRHYALLALAINFFGSGFYLWSMFTGSVKPHPVTWLLWSLPPYIAFVAQLSQGVQQAAWLTLMVGVNPTIILLVSLRNRESHWVVTRSDALCGVVSLAGVILWAALGQADFAIALAIAADAIAAVPTFRKTVTNPETETISIYACLAVAALITLATIDDWAFAQYGFALYLAILGLILAATIGIARKRKIGDNVGGPLEGYSAGPVKM
jgi:hypothetical protein